MKRKLTDRDVQRIHDLRAKGLTTEGIARVIGDITQQHVSRVLRGVHWRTPELRP